MSLSLYIGSEPAYKVDASAWDHDLTDSQVMQSLHETIRAIPTLSNEELHIVVGKHGEPIKDHEHCAGRTCWQDRYPCPEGGGSPSDPNIMAMDLEDHQAPQTERWVRRALLRLAADIIELESTLGDYPSAEDLEAHLSRLETEDDDLERRVTDLENRFTDLETP